MSTAVDWQAVVRRALHPVQAEVLGTLADVGEASPQQLYFEHGVGAELSFGAVCYHARRLRDLGLIRVSRTTASRGSLEHFYVLGEARAER